jgi:hypothetical protein
LEFGTRGNQGASDGCWRVGIGLPEKVFQGRRQFRELKSESVGEGGLGENAFTIEQFVSELA